jgi:predicted unusual protein kinase regulating ubiquinone biosynthesis (AarF/ABC1/UbiB family)
MVDLPTRGIARAARLAALPAGYVGRRAVGIGRRVGGAPAELLAEQVQARTAEQLFTVLGDLKGGAMKVGQWLSAMEPALPEQMAGAYGEALTRLQEAAPALPIRALEPVLAEELGEDWRSAFQHFDEEPTAAASVGQVHRARWRDGRDVAVKVQYPGAGAALATDLRQLDRLVPVVRVAAPGVDARQLFSQLRQHVQAETDYLQEARAQNEFRAGLADDPDFVVPGVVTATPRVLVSGWLDGTPVAQVARTGSHAQRDRAGLLLSRFLLSSPVRVGRLHGDPHPGNFRLTDDGRLVVLDFGSTLTMPSGWPPRLIQLLHAGRDHDPAALLEIATAAGIVSPRTVSAAALLELVAPLLEPLRVERYTFTRGWLRAQTMRFSDPRSSVSRTQRKLHVPVRYMLVQRVAVGTTGVLCQLGATVPVRGEVHGWLAG